MSLFLFKDDLVIVIGNKIGLVHELDGISKINENVPRTGFRNRNFHG